MPSVPRANTNLTCFMIGEKVGEWIRTDPSEYGISRADASTQPSEANGKRKAEELHG